MHPELSLLAVSVGAWLGVVILHVTMPSHGAQHCLSVPHAAAHHHGAMSLDFVADRCVAMPSDATGFPSSLALWVVMAAAMMLPTALPTARSISMNGRWNRRHRSQVLFAVGYLAVWSAFGALVLAVAWFAGSKAGGAPVVSGLLATAAAWELTRRKRFLLRACHRVRALPADGCRADRACLGDGVRNGLQCGGACGPMMLPMALAPHALWLMVVLFGVVVAEKLVTKAVDHLRIFAAVLAVVAFIVAFGAPLG
ncbi:copper chaperone [Mycolicibacterium lutetiense]